MNPPFPFGRRFRRSGSACPCSSKNSTSFIARRGRTVSKAVGRKARAFPPRSADGWPGQHDTGRGECGRNDPRPRGSDRAFHLGLRRARRATICGTRPTDRSVQRSSPRRRQVLADGVQAWAQGRNAPNLEVSVWSFNVEAIEFYQRLDSSLQSNGSRCPRHNRTCRVHSRILEETVAAYDGCALDSQPAI